MIKVKDKKYCYEDIIDLVLGQDIGIRIKTYSIKQLERGDFKEMVDFKKKAFQIPLKIENPASNRLGEIGK